MSTSRSEFKIQNFTTSSGESIEELSLVYKTYGELNAEKNNVIIFPTYYTGIDTDNERLIGVDNAIDPSKYFIIVPNMFGNGVSTSPSNTPGLLPYLSVLDNVLAQKELLNMLGVDSIKLAIGWSMGGMQAYQWASYFPDMVLNAMVICSSSKTSIHNQVFLEGLKSILDADPNFNLLAKTDVSNGLKSFGKVYAGWAYSQEFYRNHQYKQLGFESHQALLESWADDHAAWDARDLYFMLNTWLYADISLCDKYESNLELALSSISAKVILMPCNQDLYFRYDDNLIEAQKLSNVEMRNYDSDFGHCSAGPGRIREITHLITAEIAKICDDF